MCACKTLVVRYPRTLRHRYLPFKNYRNLWRILRAAACRYVFLLPGEASCVLFPERSCLFLASPSLSFSTVAPLWRRRLRSIVLLLPKFVSSSEFCYRIYFPPDSPLKFSGYLQRRIIAVWTFCAMRDVERLSFGETPFLLGGMGVVLRGFFSIRLSRLPSLLHNFLLFN